MNPVIDYLSFLTVATLAGFCVSKRRWGMAVFEGLLALYLIAVIAVKAAVA